MRPAAMGLLTLVDAGHIIGGDPDVAQWPWTWHRLLGYCRTIKNVYERAAMDEEKETAMPPKWMWWEPDELDAWFEERRENARERARSSSVGEA